MSSDPVEGFSPALYYPVNQFGDIKYLNFLWVGLIISLLSALGLLYLAWREQSLTSR